MKIDPNVLRATRTKAGLTKRRLARAADVSITTITSLETTGDITHLTHGLIAKVAAALDVPVEELFTQPDRESTPPAGSDLAGELGGALLDHRDLPIDALAEITQDGQLQAALDQVRATLNTIGIGLSITDGRVNLTPHPRTVLTDERIIAARVRTQRRRQIGPADARIVYKAMNGASEKTLRADPDGYARTGALINGGLLSLPGRPGDAPALTDDVGYSLLLDAV